MTSMTRAAGARGSTTLCENSFNSQITVLYSIVKTMRSFPYFLSFILSTVQYSKSCDVVAGA